MLWVTSRKLELALLLISTMLSGGIGVLLVSLIPTDRLKFADLTLCSTKFPKGQGSTGRPAKRGRNEAEDEGLKVQYEKAIRW